MIGQLIIQLASLNIIKRESGLNYSINDENIGVIKNFENAISKCSGEYILLSDQDDIWEQTQDRSFSKQHWQLFPYLF